MDRRSVVYGLPLSLIAIITGQALARDEQPFCPVELNDDNYKEQILTPRSAIVGFYRDVDLGTSMNHTLSDRILDFVWNMGYEEMTSTSAGRLIFFGAYDLTQYFREDTRVSGDIPTELKVDKPGFIIYNPGEFRTLQEKEAGRIKNIDNNANALKKVETELITQLDRLKKL